MTWTPSSLRDSGGRRQRLSGRESSLATCSRFRSPYIEKQEKGVPTAAFFLEPWCSVRKTIAAKATQQRLASVVVAIATASIVAMTAGCARTPYYGDPLSGAGPGSAPEVVAGPTVFNPSATKGSGSAPLVGAERDNGSQASRLQRRERTIEGRIRTIDRQLDIIDMRRHRQRLDIEPYRRYRPGPREVLLQRENRNLQFEQRSVRRELNQLEFERRIGQSPPDPFANSRRFPSPSILKQ
jgi:hypothetical protein